MISISELKQKIINAEHEDFISMIDDTEIIWDDIGLNNRIFQELACLGDLESVQKMLANQKYHVNLNEINYFFFEKLIYSKCQSVLLFLVENHYIDKHIDDLFVYIAPSHLDLLKLIFPYIHNNFTLEKAFVNIIFKDNLENFRYLLEKVGHEQFTSDFLIVSLEYGASQTREYILKKFPREYNQFSFNKYINRSNRSINYKLVKHLINYGYKLPAQLPQGFTLL